MENYVIALDLGTSSTSIIAGLIDAREPYGVKVIHQETAPQSLGIKRGSIYNAGEAQKMINNLIMGAERKIKKSPQVKKWYIANVSGLNYRCENHRYDMNTSSQTITEVTLNMLKNEAQNRTVISMDEEMLRFVPTGYSLDSAPIINNPVDYIANKTEGFFLAYIASKEAINNINQAMPKTSKLNKVYTAASAKSAVLLSSEDKKSGVAFVDLGAGTTNIAIAFKGAIQYEVSIPFGSNAITTDIAQGMEMSEEKAEVLKKAYGLAAEKMNNDRIVRLNIDEEDVECDMNRLDFIIRARAEEIISYVDSAIMQSRNRSYVKNIVLAGGGAELKGIADLFTEKTGIPTRVAVMPKTSIDATEDLALAMGMASIFARENKSLFIDNKESNTPSLFDQDPQPVQPKVDAPVAETAPQEDKAEKKSSFLKQLIGKVGDMINDGPDFNEEKKD
ncbi:MAG: cell division protein FtsA [Bacteroidales bacterium]|nr:cell division protein FtsA [Bacteroidales bacterium]